MTIQDNTTAPRVLGKSFGRALSLEEVQSVSGGRWVRTSPHPTIHNDNGPIEVETDYEGSEWI